MSLTQVESGIGDAAKRYRGGEQGHSFLGSTDLYHLLCGAWGIQWLSKPNSVLSGACILMRETDKSKQAKVPGGHQCSEVKQDRVKGPRQC